MSSRPVARRAAPIILPDDPDPPAERPNACGAEVEARLRQAEATAALAQAGERLALAIDRAVDQLKPAADGIHGLLEAQQKLCAFLVRHRLKVAASIPTVLIAIGAASPNAARALAELLRVWGVL